MSSTSTTIVQNTLHYTCNDIMYIILTITMVASIEDQSAGGKKTETAFLMTS